MLSLEERDERPRNVLSLESEPLNEVAPGYIEEQSAKLHLTLGQDSPGVERLASSFTLNNALDYKRMLVQQEELQKVQLRNDILAEMMAQGPTKVDDGLVETVRGLTDLEIKSGDVSNVIERKYAEFYTNYATAQIENNIVEDAEEVDQEVTLDLLDRTERVVYKKNLISTKAAELQKRIDDLGWGSTIWNFTERMVPFVEWYQKQNVVGDGSEMVSSFLPGNNLEEQFSYLWSISDPQEFAEKFETALGELSSRNEQVAMSWLEGLISYGSTDAFVDNLFGVADMASVVPIGTLSNALKGVIKGAARSPLAVHRHAADLGKNAEAAAGKIVQELKTGTFVDPDINNFKALEQSVPSVSTPDMLMVGSQNVPQAAYLRMKEALMGNSELIGKFLYEPNLIDRLNPEELVKYKDVLLEEYVKQNPSVQKNVIDVRIADATDVGNVYTAEVVIGQADGTLFESAKQAETYFKTFIDDTNDFTIRQVGQGFEIAIKKTVDESKFLSDLRIPLMNKTPSLNIFSGWWRSPNYAVSRKQELARSTAVTSMERLTDIYEELAKPFSRLSKQEAAELNDIMSVNQHSSEFKNFGEFEQAFFLRNGKTPTEDQTISYFSGRQMMDLDLMVRDLDWYKQKAIQGREKITMTVGDERLEFEGKVLDELPFGSKTPFAYQVIKKGVPESRKFSNYANDAARAEVRKLIEQGFKVVQVANARLKIGEKHVAYVVTDSLKRDRVGVQNVQRRAGGHKVDTYKGYAKQGRFTDAADRMFYNSDVTHFGFQSETTGRKYVDALNQARLKWKARDKDAVKFVRDTLGVSPKRWAAAVKDGSIDLDVKFVYTPKGRSTLDTGGYDDIKNLTKDSNEHDLDSRLIGRYGGERDESNIKNIVSESDVKFRADSAEYLSPMDTLNMSAKNVLSTRMMHDYTIMTHRDFLREFGDLLEGTREEHLASGISTLTNPRFKDGAPADRVALAKNVSRAYNNLLNKGTELDNKIEFFKDKLLSSIMPKFGPRGQQWVTERMLSREKDPGVFMRSFAFNTKMGFFNPNQLFVQANSMVNVVSVAGMNGMKGGLAWLPTRAALLNNSPEVLARLGKTVENLKIMKADEFVESVNLYKKSGFNSIGKDTAYLDDVRGPEIRSGAVKSGAKKFLAYGTTPFNEGERIVRVAAWHAAYLEKRALKKGALTRRDEAEILQRAKDLTVNMTRESNAAWQKGYGGVLTQFMGYQARLLEQFVGKKLTGAEKIRLFTGFSAVYGVPVAVGATTGVIPVRDWLMDELTEGGYQTDDTAFEPFLDGFVNSFVEYLTGNELSIADRYGPGGLPTFYDLFREDSTWMDVMLGASGSIGIDTAKAAAPIFKKMYSEMFDVEGEQLNLTVEDMLHPLRVISTVDNATKLWQVYNVGIWMTKNGHNITEMDLPEGIMAAITGLQPERIEETFRQNKANKNFKDQTQAWINEAAREYQKIFKMDVGPERELLTRQLKARMISQGLGHAEIRQAWKRGMDQEMMTDSVMEKYQEMLRQQERAN